MRSVLTLLLAGHVLALAAAPPPQPQSFRLPAYFEPNQGQTDPRVKFIARGFRGQIWIAANEVVTAVTERPARDPRFRREPRFELESEKPVRRSVIRMKLVGANPAARAEGREKLASYSNYFLGNDSKKWRPNVPNYAEAWLRDVWPGIDMRFYSNAEREFEYDFVVKPGADASLIRFEFEGAPVELSRTGDLELRTALGLMTQRAPVVRQRGQVLESAYARRGRGFGVVIAGRDPAEELVVDPVIAWYTYLGGNGDEFRSRMALDVSGAIYATGSTSSTDFPTAAGAFQSTYAANADAYLVKLDSTARNLVYSTYLGGAGTEGYVSIAVDLTGSAFLSGLTKSANFPTTSGSFRTSRIGSGDVFVAKLSAAGNSLSYSTYFGGSNGDNATGIVVDASGSAFVVGNTESADLPASPGSLQPTFKGEVDAFVLKLSPSGSQVLYATYLGGAKYDWGAAICIDGNGDAYVAGSTRSPDFPMITGAFQGTLLSGNADAFVVKLGPAGTAALYSTFLGGSGYDDGTSIAVDSAGRVYVAGYTDSANFPVTTGAFLTSRGGIADGFVAELNPAGSGLIYSTYLGGANNSDTINGIVVDSTGSAYVAGQSCSTNFPTTPGAPQPTAAGGCDAVIAKLSPAGNSLQYSTYIGGTASDWADSVVIDGAGAVFVSGATTSANLATPGAFQRAKAGGFDTFILKLNADSATTLSSFPKPTNFGQNATLSATVLPAGATGTVTFYDGVTVLGTSPLIGGVANLNTTVLPTGIRTLGARYSGDSSYPPSVATPVSHTVLTAASQTYITPTGNPFPAGSTPMALVVADFNNDGRHDYATANNLSNNVTVMLANGSGGFTPMPGSPFSTAPNLGPLALAVGDFNTDSFPDLAVVNGTSTVSLLLSGGGTFASAAGGAVQSGARAIVAADFDGDGRADLAIANDGGNSVTFLKGGPSGLFTSAFGGHVPVAPRPTGLTVGDFNGDGKPDVATASFNNSSITILLGTGVAFTRTDFSLGVNRPQAIATGHFNGDAFLDLVVTLRLTNQVMVLPGAGTGAFGPGIASATGGAAVSLVTGDFTGDGLTDVATANFTANTISVLPGNGTGAFGAGLTAATGGSPIALAAGQFDSDPRTDFAIANSADNNVTIRLGAGTVTTSLVLTAPLSSVQGSPVTMTATLTPTASPGSVTFYAGPLLLGTSPLIAGTATFTYTGLAAGTHLLRATYGGSGVFLPSTSNTVSHNVIPVSSRFLAPAAPVSSYASPGGPLFVVTADFTGDGRLDFATLRNDSQGVNVYRGGGKGDFTLLSGSPFPTGTGPYAMAAGDLDGDGDQDIVTVQRNAGTISVLLNDGAGGFTPAAGSGFAAGNAPSSIAVSDLNGDGRADLVVANYGAGEARVFPGLGAGIYGPPVIWPMGVQPSAVLVADFNGDGRPDIATANAGGSGDVTLRLGNGAGSFGSPASYQVGNGDKNMIAADLNGDSRPDLALTLTSSGGWCVLFSSGPGSFAAPVCDVLPGALGISAGDVDGDGDRDLLLPDSSGNTVAVLLNNGKGTFEAATYSPVPVGNSPWMSALGDFNADGRLDAVVANVGDNSVSVLLGQASQPTAKLVVSYAVARDTSVTPNQWVVTASVSNLGPPAQVAQNVTVTKATLGGVPTSGPASVNLGNLTGGATKQAQLRFPVGGALVSGASVLMSTAVSSSLTGGGSYPGLLRLP